MKTVKVSTGQIGTRAGLPINSIIETKDLTQLALNLNTKCFRKVNSSLFKKISL